MESGKADSGVGGRKFVVTLMLLCAACGVWIAASAYRMSAANKAIDRTQGQLDEALIHAKTIIEHQGTRGELDDLDGNQFTDLIYETQSRSLLKLRRISETPDKRTDKTIEFTRTIEIEENDINTIVQFLVELKKARPDVIINRINLDSISRSRRNWSGSLDIQMIQRLGPGG